MVVSWDDVAPGFDALSRDCYLDCGLIVEESWCGANFGKRVPDDESYQTDARGVSVIKKNSKKFLPASISRGLSTFAKRRWRFFFGIFMMAGKQNQEGYHGQWIPDLLSFLFIFFTFVKIIL